jgi:hypothetical protein
MKRIIDNPKVQSLITPPQSLPGKAGFYGEQVSEVAATPELSEARLGKLPGIVKSGVKVAQEGARMGATEYIQTGGDARAAATAALTAGAFTGIGEVIGHTLIKSGQKIQSATIRATQRDFEDGFKYENMQKYGIKGDLGSSINQIDSKLTELRNTRKGLIGPGKADVDLGRAYDQAIQEIEQQAKAGKWGHKGDDAVAMVKDWKKKSEDLVLGPQKTPTASGLLGPNGQPIPAPPVQPRKLVVDIDHAEQAKEFTGTLGDWAYGRGVDEGKLTEDVATTLYSKLREAIERSIPQGAQLHAINRQMQELIPMKRTIMRRIPVEQRNRMFSLADLTALIPAAVTGDARQLAMLALTRGQKSLPLGSAMIRHGGRSPQVTKPLGRFAAEVGTRE